MAEQTFLITGATGLLGSEVAAKLLESSDGTIIALVRAASTDEATLRLRSLWWDSELLCKAVGTRIQPIAGDITREDLGLDGELLTRLLGTTTHVIHCAAETGVQKSRKELWHINVGGTHHVSLLAKRMPNLQRFTYVSTAYVAGTQCGHIMEGPPTATSFYSLYEQSKAEAELLVRQSGLPVTICRPGMIVGNSRTGRTRNFNTVYYILRLMLQGRMPLLPVSRQQTVNVVPVDYVAQQVVSLTLHSEAKGQTFHLVAQHNELPQVGELTEAVRGWAKKHLLVSIPHPICMPIPLLRSIGRRYNAGREAKRRTLLSNLTALMPYFLDNHQFDRSNTDRLTGPYHMDWRTLLPVLLEFACRHNFMRLTDNDIFHQAMLRRKSTHNPITYYDITADGIRKLTGQEMNSLINDYVSLLHELGVHRGDRVALLGINCTRHAALDCAIGLTGATSVPIYYTTPADDIALLMQKSGARLLIRIMGPASTDVTVEKFSPHTPHSTLTGKHHSLPTSLSSFNAPLATIRYTSGTTGEPKGVMFSVHQLKWMGEVLTNLLPWADRNSEMRYLSFLPMSHVVEGILAAYAPYCMLCRARIYYLADFHQLPHALPIVRPTVFFSVPRFYEKLWEQVAQHPLGQHYFRMSDGPARRMVRRLLRRAVLRRAGLDRCSQLLVGSAPVSEDLLLHFRALGIEIHNAYGQTEAPLITLNRLGDNAIPSIGTPLPDTTVSTAPDGELLVSGPQVAMGYYGTDSPTFSNGVLHTGDLGSISADGHVYIGGRKKDLLITSYGKNINCTKIEQRLCDIPCVEHAVLVGEQRPFCTALLWTDGHDQTLADDISRMNQGLSHPEQIKRWRVIATPLSIQHGELTPNLKVRRQVVWQHFWNEIEAMYGQQ